VEAPTAREGSLRREAEEQAEALAPMAARQTGSHPVTASRLQVLESPPERVEPRLAARRAAESVHDQPNS
jgi:hypothetical protein